MSIRNKLILTIIISVTISAVVIVLLLNRSYENNIKLLAEESVATAQQTFSDLEQNDIRMMSSTLQALLDNPKYKPVFESRDRQKLFDTCNPLFTDLQKNYGLRGWVFYEPEPKNTFFLRMQKPKEFGDVNWRITYKNAVKNKTFSSGKELGNNSYSLRVVAPYYDGSRLIGYMELNEDVDKFLEIMKKQTGNDYGLLIGKASLKKDKWASMRKDKKLPNNWDNLRDIVVANKTSVDESIVDYQGKVADIPDKGTVLQEITKDKKIYVRGVFPLYDASNQKVGGVFVLKDITHVHNDLMAMRNKAIGFIIAMLFIISIIIIAIFNKLIIARLNHMINIATRAVGGEFSTEIKPATDDEIGKFEVLFEQFRVVFASLVRELERKSFRKIS